MISVLNYGMGNLGSVLNMLKRIGVQAEIVDDPASLSMATKILLPGVGAFDNAMKRINESGFREVLDKKALVEKVPILGICLGMQLLTRGSEEGVLPGLGWIAADTIRFPDAPGLKVPHMGWNVVKKAKSSPLTADLPPEPRFYFVHSYKVTCDSEENVLCSTDYGTVFHSGIYRDNVLGVQFHPEKSHFFGMKLLENFALYER